MSDNGGSKTSNGMVAIIFGLLGTLLGAYIQGCNNLQLEREKLQAEHEKFNAERERLDADSKLEREKFETSLIFKAIETGNPERAAQNLDFLVKADLISDPGGKIAALVKDPATTPVLSCSTSNVPGKGEGPRGKR